MVLNNTKHRRQNKKYQEGNYYNVHLFFSICLVSNMLLGEWEYKRNYPIKLLDLHSFLTLLL